MKKITKDYWNEEIFKQLTGLNDKQICAFDFDNTLIQDDFGSLVIYKIITDGLDRIDEEVFSSHFRDSSEAKNQFKNRKQNIKNFHKYFHLEYLWNFENKGMEFAYRWSSFIFQGFSENELNEIAREVWKQENGKSFRPYPAMLELIEFLKDKNWDLWIVTASTQWCIAPISHYFGISHEKVLGMKLEVEDERMIEKIQNPYTFAKGKVQRLKENVDSYHLAFGDSRGDFELLQGASEFGVFLYNGNYTSPSFENVKIQSIHHWRK